MAMRTHIALVFALVLATPAVAETIVGRASVIDGDTVEIRGQRIRLSGVDAPESGQLCQVENGKNYRCGQKAALALSDKIGTANVSCEQTDTDRYGRVVATCSLNGEDLNRWLVSQGHALAYRQYGGDAYDAEEEEAKGAKRGVWVGPFTPPWDWRRHNAGLNPKDEAAEIAAPVTVAAGPEPKEKARSEPCLIKGNINGKDERIYHVPGSRWYDRTVLNTWSGERWFCTEEEARAAGWRAPRG
jgi:endonuclease YncB( thermonuclease family)